MDDATKDASIAAVDACGRRRARARGAGRRAAPGRSRSAIASHDATLEAAARPAAPRGN